MNMEATTSGDRGPQGSPVGRREDEVRSASPVTAPLLVGAGVLLLVAAIVIGAFAVTDRTGRDAVAIASPMVAPEGVIDIASISGPLASQYRHVESHRDDYRDIRCYCGCEAAFGHESLADCYIRPDGRGEAHAAGCAVCQAEATTVSARLDAGDSPAAIAAVIDARYGSMTPASTTTPPPPAG